MRLGATIVRRAALVLTALFAVVGLLFALGYAYEDPGGWAALAITAALAVPLVALVLLAIFTRRAAYWIVVAGVAVFAAWQVAVLAGLRVEAPVTPLVALVLSVPIAVLGQRRAGRAAALMLADAAVPLMAVLTRMARAQGPERPGLAALLGGSTGVVVIPLLVLAALFGLAALLGRRGVPAPGTRPTAGTASVH